MYEKVALKMFLQSTKCIKLHQHKELFCAKEFFRAYKLFESFSKRKLAEKL